MLYNFHTHSHLDDGKESLENYVISSIEKGLKALGFSAHSPISIENEWCLPENDLPLYCKQVKKLKKKYAGKTDIYLGLEIDYIPGISEFFGMIKQKNDLEYCIGSVHLVKNPKSTDLWFIDGPEEGYINGIKNIFDNNPRYAVEAFYNQSFEMIINEKPDIIGHLDKVKMHNKGRFFSEQDTWYIEAVDKLLKAISQNKTIVEVNTRGKYKGKTDEFFPSKEILEKCYMLKIPVMVNTDAHKPTQVNSLFDEAVNLLKDIGYKETQTPFFKTKI